MSSSPGGGLGGLALAQGLQRAGITALKALLTPQAFKVFAATAGTPGARMDSFDHRLRLPHAQELPTVEDLPGGGHLALNRRTLRQILLAGLEKSVHYGSALTRYETNRSGTVTAYFADGASATGDVLIGADGVNSATRRQHLPQAQVVDAGLRLLYGKVPLAGDAARELVPARASS